MRDAFEAFINSKVVIALSATLAFILLCVGATIAFGLSGPERTLPPAAQPDARPSSLTVITGGDGVGSPEAAAALQSQSPQSSNLAAPSGTQSTLMGQVGGTDLQAGLGSLTAPAKPTLPDDNGINPPFLP